MSGVGDPLFLREETYRIRGAAFDVYRNLGAGFLESVYQECLSIELSRQRIPFEALKPLSISYRGQPLQQTYVVDFVCFDQIVVELKAARAIAPEHRAQTMNYLRAGGMKVGLLVNFGAFPGAEIERFVV